MVPHFVLQRINLALLLWNTNTESYPLWTWHQHLYLESETHFDLLLADGSQYTPLALLSKSSIWRRVSIWAVLAFCWFRFLSLYCIFPKYFHWIQRIHWQKYLSLKGSEPATSCVRDQDVTTEPGIWGIGSLNLAQFMLQWFIRFPEFAEFNENSTPFRKKNALNRIEWEEIQTGTITDL